MLLASAGSAQQRTWMYYSNAKSYIGKNTILNVQGTAQRPMGLRFDGNSMIDNNGRIFLYGDFVNNVPAGQPNVFVFPKAPDPIQSELRFRGDSISLIRGKTETRFNNLYIQKKDHSVPVVQKIKSFIDEPSVLTIDGSQLSNCYPSGDPLRYQNPAAHMVVLNTDPKAVVSIGNGFVSAEDDSLLTDWYTYPNPPVPPYKGGRLVWHMKDHVGEDYIFPVGNFGLNPYKREVTIVNKNAEERVFAVRVVATSAENNGYPYSPADNPTVCKLNQFFYHIIDDSTDLKDDEFRMDTTRKVDLRIRYEKSDGVFNDIGIFNNSIQDGTSPSGSTDVWKDLKSTDEDTAFFKADWNDFGHPVFALYPVKALDGLSMEKLPPADPNDPYFRMIHKIKFSDNKDNIDGLTYEWKMEYLDNSSNPPQRILVGTSSNRYPEFPSDFGVDPGPPTYTPGEYCFSVRVINPAAPPDAECEGKGDTCLFLLPERAAYVPNGFSPNSDGTNNEWKAQFYGFDEVSVEIYNRWGLLIYTKIIKIEDGTVDGDRLGKPPKNSNTLDDKENGVVLWNGKTQGGDPVPEGAYVYKLRMVTNPPTPLNKVWEQNGMITVVR